MQKIAHSVDINIRKYFPGQLYLKYVLKNSFFLLLLLFLVIIISYYKVIEKKLRRGCFYKNNT